MYVNKLKALDAVREPDTIRSLIGELDMYSALLKSVPDGQEGLASGLPKMLIGVVDVFLRIGNTFKTNVFKFHKRLKRGEMRYFMESNRLKVAKVEDAPYARFIKLRLNAPSGMAGFYVDAIANITKTYEQLALKDTIVPLVDKLTQVQRMLVNSDASVSPWSATSCGYPRTGPSSWTRLWLRIRRSSQTRAPLLLRSFPSCTPPWRISR